MRLVLMSEAPPPVPGMYHCKVEVHRFTQNDKYIMKDVVGWSSEGKWLTSESNHTVVAWVDESESDQNKLWDELQNTLIHYEEGFSSGPIDHGPLEHLKTLYTITRK